jgi:hypothetical protein
MSTPSKIQNEAQILIGTGTTEEIRKLASLIKDLAKHVESNPPVSAVKALVAKTASEAMGKQ